MSNASYLFSIDAMHSAARRRARGPLAAGGWWRLWARAWREAMKQRRDAAALDALNYLDAHLLRDIGATDELLERAAILRERREHPFAPASPRGIESASRRVEW